MSGPAFLLVEVAGEHARQVALFDDMARLLRSAGGDVVAYGPAGRVACFEPGTIAAGLLLARFADGEDARRAGEAHVLPRLGTVPADTPRLVLLAAALPHGGLPDQPEIPTAASVPRPRTSARNCFLVIRGSAWDAARLDAYRDVILPMHFERDALYESFAIQPGEVEALAGTWSEQIFAVSRWPTRAHAEDFWFSDRYQQVAIPLRLGAGRFSVHALEAS